MYDGVILFLLKAAALVVILMPKFRNSEFGKQAYLYIAAHTYTWF